MECVVGIDPASVVPRRGGNAILRQACELEEVVDCGLIVEPAVCCVIENVTIDEASAQVPACVVGLLEYNRIVTAVLEKHRGRQTRDSGTDDHHATHSSAPAPTGVPPSNVAHMA